MSRKSPKPKAPEPPEVPETFPCPLTGHACKAGQPAECEHFWRCVREALDIRRPGRDVTKLDPDHPQGAAGDV